MTEAEKKKKKVSEKKKKRKEVWMCPYDDAGELS